MDNNSSSGQPTLLKILKDQAVIYSVGRDGRDDGGDYVTGKDTTFRVGLRPLWEIDADAAKAERAAEQKQDP